MASQPSNAPVMHAPAPSEPTIPEAWRAGIPSEYLGAFYAAQFEVEKLPVPTRIVEAQNPSTLIMAAELVPAHRYDRFVLMADFSVRSMSPEEYEKLLNLPQNGMFVKLLEGARKAADSPRLVKRAKEAAKEKAKARGTTLPAEAPKGAAAGGHGH